MLCLGLDFGESLIIGKPGDVLTEPIVVTFLRNRSSGSDARLGVDAQRSVRVVRRELLEQRDAAERRAVVAQGKDAD
jgi:sRNA-binding carbon storage regulator CsrA